MEINYNPLDTAPRSTLPLLATALLAVLFVIRGFLHPALNYDVIGYAALAKEMRGDGGKAETYRELAAKVGNSGFQLYISGPYRERMYRDDGFFQANLPFYRIRPLYIFLCSVVGSLVHSDIAATHIISAVAAALALLLSYAIAGAAGLAGYWRLVIPLTWIVAGGLNLASLSTPDALETFVALLFVLISITRPWTGGRAIWLLVFAFLMVVTRIDALLLLACLMLLEWLLEPRHRLVSTLVMLCALATSLVTQKISGGYGYVADLNFSLIDRSRVPDFVPNLHGYIPMFIHEVFQTLGEDFEYALMSLAVTLLGFAWIRERHVRAADEFNQLALILSGALALYLIVRFALFPLPLARYLMTAYVLAGILFARAIQPPPAARKDPTANSAAP
jgi:hypothetical protein